MMRNPKHLRERAQDCLNISKGIRTCTDRTMLEDIAAEMNATAAAIEDDKGHGLSASGSS
jgi:hypothetical protein